MLETTGAGGYEQTSVRTVLDQADLYRQAFYDNFASKEDCFLHAYEAGLNRVETMIRAAAAAETTWRGQLRAGLGALLDFLDAKPDVGRALIVEVHPAGGEAVARQAEAMARFRDFLDRARSEAPAGAEAPPIAAEALASGIHTVLHLKLSRRDAAGFKPLLGELMYLAVLPFYGVEAASEELRPVASPS